MKRKRHALAILAFTTLFGCSQQSIPATTPTLDAVVLEFQSTNDLSPLLRELTTRYSEEFPHVTFHAGTGDYGILLRNLESGDTSFFMSSRLPEVQQWAVPIAQDGIAVVVNANNSVAELSIDQLRDIYSGSLTNWRQLDGPHRKITVLTRELDVDTRSEFERMVMGQRRTTANAEIIPSDEAMVQRISQIPGSIGYISLALLHEDTKALAIDGILPSRQTVIDNTYPIRSTIFVVGGQEPQQAQMDFILWIQSTTGQSIITERYAPLPP